jgi:hypothetical protein
MTFEAFCKAHYPQYQDNPSFWLGAADHSDGRADCPYGLSGYGSIAWNEGWTAAQAWERNRPRPEDYAPYHTMPAFNEGIDDYMSGRYDNPYTDPRDGVKAQAHDRGSEYAMRVVRHRNKHRRNDSRAIT